MFILQVSVLPPRCLISCIFLFERVSLFTICIPDILLYLVIYICANLPHRSDLDSVKTKVIVSGWIREMDTLIPGRTVTEEEAVILCSLTGKMC